MKIVDLPVTRRDKTGSAESRRIRRGGGIPCNLYGGDRGSVSLTTSRDAFAEVLKAHTALVRLRDDAVEQTALIRDVAWDTFGEFVEHLDLVRVSMTDEVKVRVPIHFTGTPAGQKHGGVLVENNRDIEVFAQVKSIPSELPCDVSALEIGDGIRIADIELPEGVRTEMPEEEMIVQCTEPQAVIIEEPEGEEVEGEGEAPVEGEAPDAESEKPAEEG
jgi:large subunit ribosomal protein L25